MYQNNGGYFEINSVEVIQRIEIFSSFMFVSMLCKSVRLPSYRAIQPSGRRYAPDIHTCCQSMFGPWDCHYLLYRIRYLMTGF